VNRARLFFALWPDDDMRKSLSALAQDAQLDCGGRATSDDKVHLTLFFLGDVDARRAVAVEGAADRVRGEFFDLTLDRIGYWRHNRIVWAGATYQPPALSVLVTRLSAGLAAEGVESEGRPYVPHLTLVRNAERKPALAVIEPHPWHVRDFVLVQSMPTRGGVRYQVLRTWPFALALKAWGGPAP